MESRFAKLEASRKVAAGQIFTPYCEKILMQERQTARQFLVRRGDDQNALIMKPGPDNLVWAVNLGTRTCSCREFQNHDIPCQHAIAFIYALGHRLDAYVSVAFLVDTWKRIYSENLRPIAFLTTTAETQAQGLNNQPENLGAALGAPLGIGIGGAPGMEEREPVLAAGMTVIAPTGRATIGKRKKARGVVGQRSRATGQTQQQCSSCWESGHHARSCRIRTFK